LVSSLFPQYPT
jgi:hypothetical protein